MDVPTRSAVAMTESAAPSTHDHTHGHVHAPARSATTRALWLAFALTAGFGVVEAAAGWLSGSLALISDAGHMATDSAAFVVALIAQALARRPPSTRASYGYARAEVLAAFINALAMLALVVWIAAGAVVQFTGWTPIDPILSIVVVLLILRSTLALLRQSTGVLMERVPAHLSYDAIGRALAALPGVTGVHDLHVWQMSAERPALSAHVTLSDGAAWPRVLAAAQRLLARDFGIDHVTLQPSWPVTPPSQRRVPVPVVADKGAGDSSRTP